MEKMTSNEKENVSEEPKKLGKTKDKEKKKDANKRREKSSEISTQPASSRGSREKELGKISQAEKKKRKRECRKGTLEKKVEGRVSDERWLEDKEYRRRGKTGWGKGCRGDAGPC